MIPFIPLRTKTRQKAKTPSLYIGVYKTLYSEVLDKQTTAIFAKLDVAGSIPVSRFRIHKSLASSKTFEPDWSNITGPFRKSEYNSAVINKPPQQMSCMEVWSGSQLTDTGVEFGGLDAWVYSKPFGEARRGGDVYYASSCATVGSRACYWRM